VQVKKVGPKNPGTQLSQINQTGQDRKVQIVQQAKPEWHAPWKLMRVISGHLGWVRSLAVEPNNQWFASGAGIGLSKFGTLRQEISD